MQVALWASAGAIGALPCAAACPEAEPGLGGDQELAYNPPHPPGPSLPTIHSTNSTPRCHVQCLRCATIVLLNFCHFDSAAVRREEAKPKHTAAIVPNLTLARSLGAWAGDQRKSRDELFTVTPSWRGCWSQVVNGLLSNSISSTETGWMAGRAVRAWTKLVEMGLPVVTSLFPAIMSGQFGF